MDGFAELEKDVSQRGNKRGSCCGSCGATPGTFIFFTYRPDFGPRYCLGNFLLGKCVLSLTVLIRGYVQVGGFGRARGDGENRFYRFYRDARVAKFDFA